MFQYAAAVNSILASADDQRHGWVHEQLCSQVSSKTQESQTSDNLGDMAAEKLHKERTWLLAS